MVFRYLVINFVFRKIQANFIFIFLMIFLRFTKDKFLEAKRLAEDVRPSYGGGRFGGRGGGRGGRDGGRGGGGRFGDDRRGGGKR